VALRSAKAMTEGGFMRRRLYFIIPNASRTREVINELLLAQIEIRHIHVLAHRDMDMSGLHEASFLQKTDIVHGAEIGMVVGGAVGILAGAIMVAFPVEGMNLQLGAILLTALLGAVFGAWVSSLIGISTPNVRLKQFEPAIEAGELLLIVDVPKSRINEISEYILLHHPEAKNKGMEPTVPAFP